MLTVTLLSESQQLRPVGTESVSFDAQDNTVLETKDQSLHTHRTSFLNPELNWVWN